MKQITKTILASILSLGMVFSLVACGSSDEEVSEEPTVSKTVIDSDEDIVDIENDINIQTHEDGK